MKLSPKRKATLSNDHSFRAYARLDEFSRLRIRMHGEKVFEIRWNKAGGSKPSTTTRAIGSERCAPGRPRFCSSNHGPLMPLRKFQIAAKRVHVKGEA